MKKMRRAWRETTRQERNMRIFREELDSFLPRKILDFHVHLLNPGVLPRGETYSCGGHPLEKYDLRDLDRDLREVYPGRETFAVCFGFPHVDYDMARNNRYVAERCDGKRLFPLRLFDPTTDTAETVDREVAQQGFLGLKPYLDYVRKKNPRDVEVREMLPDWVMEIADRRRLIVMLHIPRKERLADPVNQRQIATLCRRYPGAKLVLAHVGRAYYLKNIAGQIEKLKDIPNLWFDLAMLNNADVLEYLFRTVDCEKIVYATDTPIALAPGKSVEINNQYTYVTPVPWHLSVTDDKKKIVFTSFLYEELRAIKRAMERLGLGKDFARAVFFENGMRLLEKAGKKGK